MLWTWGNWLCVSRIPEVWRTREVLDAFVTELRTMQKKLDAGARSFASTSVSADFTAVRTYMQWTICGGHA